MVEALLLRAITYYVAFGAVSDATLIVAIRYRTMCSFHRKYGADLASSAMSSLSFAESGKCFSQSIRPPRQPGRH